MTLHHIQADGRLRVDPQLLDKFEAVPDLPSCCPEGEGLKLRKGNVQGLMDLCAFTSHIWLGSTRLS